MYSTKILFTTGNYINVEEDLETILKIQEGFQMNVFQDTKCVLPQKEDTQPVYDTMENNYNSNNPHQRRRVWKGYKEYSTNQL